MQIYTYVVWKVGLASNMVTSRIGDNPYGVECSCKVGIDFESSSNKKGIYYIVNKQDHFFFHCTVSLLRFST